MANPIDIGLRIVQALDSIGIKPNTFLGKASNVKKAMFGGKPTMFKPRALETLRGTGANFNDALKLIEEEAKFVVNATDAEKMAFLNNLNEYKEFGGPIKNATSGIENTVAMQQFKNTQSELKKALDELNTSTKSMKDDAEKSLVQSKKDLESFIETGGNPFKKKETKFLGGSMHEEGQIRTGIRQFLQKELKNGRIKLNSMDTERVMKYFPTLEDDPILVFKKIYGDEAYNKAGSFPGAFEIGEDFNHYEKIFRENMGEDILKVKNKEYAGDGRLLLTESDEIRTPTPDDPDVPFAKGGIAGIRQGYAGGLKVSKKILSALNPKNIRKAVDNIFKTGDYKYDASMAAESFVELNPQLFGGKLYDDLDDATQMEIYGAVLGPIQQDVAMALKMKKASKPTKTLEGIEKTGTINISDPEVAEEFATFMKETSPGDAKKVEETVELSNFDTKGRKKNAGGGLAAMLGEPQGYYTGGMVDVEPNLSDIGHGSDSLMARTRLVSPGNQATTSTGLNYLLAEDNDNLRVPFKDGLNFDKAFEKMLEKETEVEKNPNEIIEEKITEKLTPFIPNETEKEKEEKEMFKMVEEYQKFKKDNPDSRMSLFMFRDKKKKEKTLLKNKIIELDLKYPEKEIIDKETGMVNTEKLKETVKQAEVDLEISPIDGLMLKRSIDTEGDQSVTSGSFDLGNLNFSSPNLEEGQLTSKGNYSFGDLDLSGMVDSNDGTILKTGLGFNYDNALKGKMENSDGYRSTELDLNKTFPITDKLNLNFKGGADTQTFDGKTYRSSDLTPKLSYNDGMFNADVSKEILEGGDGLNLDAGVNYNNFYAKGDNLLSEDRSGVLGYQNEFGNKDGDLFFTAGAEKNIFDDGYTGGVGLKYKFADGGRIGFSKGKGVDLARRGFLKVVAGTVGAVAALKTGALKILGKSSAKAVPKIVEIGSGSGVPPWFEPMVNKVLADGLDVTKTNAIVDGQVVRRLDTPHGKVEVYHNQRSGEIDVEYISETHAALGEPVHLNYTPGMADEGTKGVKPADEFMASENIPEGRATGPDDYDIEMGENTVGEVKNLFSDVSELQTLGGDKRLINDISVTLEKKKKLKQMQNEPSEFVTDVQGDYDPT